jgi:MFS transporter, OFA family, oxalate/formate antiporter
MAKAESTERSSARSLVGGDFSSRAVWVVLGAAIGLLGSFPATFFSTLAVFLKPIAEEFAWGRAQTVGVTVPANLGIAFGAIVAGRLIDRYGASRVIPGSALLMALAIAAMGAIPNNPILVAALSFTIGLVGVGTTPIGYLTVLPRYFDRKLGLSFGFAMAGLGLGTVLMPMLAQTLVSSQGWRMAYASLGIVSVLTAAAAWMLIFAFNNHGPIDQRNEKSAPSLMGMDFPSAKRDGRLWLLWMVVFAVSAAALGFSVHGVAIMTDRGMEAEVAARIAGLAAIGVMVGRLLGGALMDVIPARWVASTSFALGATGLWLFANDTSHSTLLLTFAAFLASFAIGAEGDFIPFAVRRYFGLKAFGAIYGVLFFGYAFGGVIGPVLMGLYFDRVGNYTDALNAAALICAFCSLAVLFLRRYRFGL